MISLRTKLIRNGAIVPHPNLNACMLAFRARETDISPGPKFAQPWVVDRPSLRMKLEDQVKTEADIFSYNDLLTDRTGHGWGHWLGTESGAPEAVLDFFNA